MEGGWEEEQGEAGTPCVTWTLSTERLSVLALPQLSGFEKTFGVGGRRKETATESWNCAEIVGEKKSQCHSR